MCPLVKVRLLVPVLEIVVGVGVRLLLLELRELLVLLLLSKRATLRREEELKVLELHVLQPIPIHRCGIHLDIEAAVLANEAERRWRRSRRVLGAEIRLHVALQRLTAELERLQVRLVEVGEERGAEPRVGNDFYEAETHGSCSQLKIPLKEATAAFNFSHIKKSNYAEIPPRRRSTR